MLHCLIQFMNPSFLKCFQPPQNPLFLPLPVIQTLLSTIQYIQCIFLQLLIMATQFIMHLLQFIMHLLQFIMILIQFIIPNLFHMIQAFCIIQNLPKQLKKLWLPYLEMLKGQQSINLMSIKRRQEMVRFSMIEYLVHEK